MTFQSPCYTLSHIVLAFSLLLTAGTAPADDITKTCGTVPYEKSENGSYYLPLCLPDSIQGDDPKGMPGVTVQARDPHTFKIVECNLYVSFYEVQQAFDYRRLDLFSHMTDNNGNAWKHQPADPGDTQYLARFYECKHPRTEKEMKEQGYNGYYPCPNDEITQSRHIYHLLLRSADGQLTDYDCTDSAFGPAQAVWQKVIDADKKSG